MWYHSTHANDTDIDPMKDKGTSASEAKTMVSQVTAVSLADTSKLSLEATNKTNKAFWGYARWDIASESSPAMKFGAFNNRVTNGLIFHLFFAIFLYLSRLGARASRYSNA